MDGQNHDHSPLRPPHSNQRARMSPTSMSYVGNPSIPNVTDSYMSKLVMGRVRPIQSHSTTQTNRKSLEALSTDSFSEMTEDIKRVYTNWLQKVENELKKQHSDLQNEYKRFEEEKLAAWNRLAQDRDRELERINEERRRIEAENSAALKQLTLERQETRRKLAEERTQQLDELDRMRATLTRTQEKHRMMVEEFEMEKMKVVDTSLAAQSMVDINVGGMVFECSRLTLTQQKGSFLESLLNGRHQVSRDRYDRIFIDRDPDLFRIILNFLRNPETPPFPSDVQKSISLVKESDYYGIKFYPYPLVFVLGGNDGTNYLQSVEVLDVAQQCWKSVRDMETPRSYGGSGVLGGRIYVFGGQNEDYKALCDVESYDVLRDEWLSVAPLHVPRRNLASCTAHDRIYAIGGYDANEILSSVEALDPRMRQWTHVTPLPRPRSGAAAAVVDNIHTGFADIYVSGGTEGKRLKTVDRYDVRTNKWECMDLMDMNVVRSAGALVSLYGTLYAIGGVDGNHHVHSSIESFDTTGNTTGWRMLKDMQIGRMDCSALAVSESIMVAGGQTQGCATNTVEFYRPDTNTWQAGPELIEDRFAHELVTCKI